MTEKINAKDSTPKFKNSHKKTEPTLWIPFFISI